jgi:hypothetical protein
MEASGQLHVPAAKAPRFPLDRKLGGPTASLDAVEKWKISFAAENKTPAFQPVVRLYSDWAVRRVGFNILCPIIPFTPVFQVVSLLQVFLPKVCMHVLITLSVLAIFPAIRILLDLGILTTYAVRSDKTWAARRNPVGLGN